METNNPSDPNAEISREIQGDEDAEAFFKSIRHLTAFLGAPKDLIEIVPICESFIPVLDGFLRYTIPDDRKKLQPIMEEALDITGTSRETALRYSVQKSKNRETLRNYYMEHAHYTSYYHPSSTIGTETLFRALQVSIIPIWWKLNNYKAIDPEFTWHRMSDLGRAVRRLTIASEANMLVLRGLSEDPVTPRQLMADIEELFKKYDLPEHLTGPAGEWMTIYRTAHWYEKNIWIKYPKGIIKQANKHAARPRDADASGAKRNHKDRNDLRLPKPKEGADPFDIKVTNYAKAPEEATYREEKFDPNLINDTSVTSHRTKEPMAPSGKGSSNRFRITVFDTCLRRSSKHRLGINSHQDKT